MEIDLLKEENNLLQKEVEMLKKEKSMPTNSKYDSSAAEIIFEIFKAFQNIIHLCQVTRENPVSDSIIQIFNSSRLMSKISESSLEDVSKLEDTDQHDKVMVSCLKLLIEGFKVDEIRDQFMKDCPKEFVIKLVKGTVAYLDSNRVRPFQE